jgi:hypothetical protein
MLRVILATIGFLFAPILLAFIYIFVEETYFPKPCRSYVDTEFAVAIIEADLKKMTSIALREGVRAKVVEIEEVGNFSDNKGPDERAYRYRLQGVRGSALPLVRVDACGRLEFAGDPSGN